MDRPFDAETIVTMNMWGLTPDFLEVLENGFEEFFEKDVKQNPTTGVSDSGSDWPVVEPG